MFNLQNCKMFMLQKFWYRRVKYLDKSMTLPIESMTPPIENMTLPIESMTPPIESPTLPIENISTHWKHDSTHWKLDSTHWKKILKKMLIIFLKFIFHWTPGFIIKIYLINNRSMGSPNNKITVYSSSNSHLLHALCVIFVGLFQHSLSIRKS